MVERDQKEFEMKEKIEWITKNGIDFRITTVHGDWEGHPDVPGGKRYLDPYVSDMTAMLNGTDITDMIRQDDEFMMDLVGVCFG